LLLKRSVAIEAVQPIEEAGPLEHFGAGLAIEPDQVVNRHALCEASRDNGASARPSYVVEVLMERSADLVFDRFQNA
jgi:hypothetical protein